MIRQAKGDDLRALVEMTQDYYEEHWFSEHTDFDPDYTFDNLKAYCVSPQANLLVAEEPEGLVGYSLAFVIPLHWCKKLRCTVAYNFIEQDYRSKGIFNDYIQAHEDWAKALGCVDINVGDGAQYNGKFGSVIKPLGFDKLGTDAYKVLN